MERLGKLAVVLAFLAFGAFNTHFVLQGGYWQVFPPFAHLHEWQLFCDLAVSLTLVNVWIALDLRARGKSLGWAAAVFLGTAAFGSMAPLVYFVLRPMPAPDAPAPAPAS